MLNYLKRRGETEFLPPPGGAQQLTKMMFSTLIKNNFFNS
jgi:hypothetical protein